MGRARVLRRQPLLLPRLHGARWQTIGRKLEPPSRRALDAGIKHVRDIERRGAILGHVLPASPELARFLDPVSQTLARIEAWQDAATREASRGEREDKPYGVVWGTETASRVGMVLQLSWSAPLARVDR